jgi:protein gp37
MYDPTEIVKFHPYRLDRFNEHKKPKVYALWNDVYHEFIKHEERKKIYHAISFAYRNTYLILTKRPQNINIEWLSAVLNNAPSNSNIWHGLTVCNQQEADEKIPIFLKVPGKKFLSIEPMLGEVKLPFNDEFPDQDGCYEDMRHHIDAVILGGETGPGARPIHPDWVRSVRDQCAAAGVPFFFKKWGNYWKTLPGKNPDDAKGRELDKRTHDDLPWLATG